LGQALTQEVLLISLYVAPWQKLQVLPMSMRLLAQVLTHTLLTTSAMVKLPLMGQVVMQAPQPDWLRYMVTWLTES
jgi:hypothetical protein